MKRCGNALVKMENDNMDYRQSNAFFWIQKKNEKNENMVVINGTLSSFDKIPHALRFFKSSSEILVKETSKTKISITRMYQKIRSGSKDFLVVCVVCVSGFIDEKDTSNRNIAYTFFYETTQSIDASVLEDIEINLNKCLELTGSLNSFDEKDFKECLSYVNPQECNNEMKSIWTRNYDWKNGIKKICQDVRRDPAVVCAPLMVLAAVTARCILGFVKKNKPAETLNDKVNK